MVHPSLPKEKLNNFGWFFPKEATTEWLNNYGVLSFNIVFTCLSFSGSVRQTWTVGTGLVRLPSTVKDTVILMILMF